MNIVYLIILSIVDKQLLLVYVLLVYNIGINMNFVGEFYVKYKLCSVSEVFGEIYL